jgi:hypothetical protein
MADVTNAVIVIAIFVVLFGVRIAVRQAFSDQVGKYADDHVWLYVVVAAGMVVWAVLDAIGVIHESAYRTLKTYIYATVSAIVLIVLAIQARSKTG